MLDRNVSLHIYEANTISIPFVMHVQFEERTSVQKYYIPTSFGNEIIEAIEMVQNGKKNSCRLLIPVQCDEIRELVLLISKEHGNQNVTIFAYHPHAMRLNFRETLHELVRIQGIPTMSKELVFS